MAKRKSSSRSEADDTAGATPGTPRPRRAGATKATEPVPPGAPMPPEAQAIRAEADDTSAVALDPGPRPESLEALTSESTSMASEPSEHDIRLRAYQRYLERGGANGMAFDDWVEAERDLRTRR
jgi:hypothetical protein